MQESSFSGQHVITNQKDAKGNTVFEKKRVVFAQTVTQKYYEPNFKNTVEVEENDDQLDGGQEGDDNMSDMVRRQDEYESYLKVSQLKL